MVAGEIPQVRETYAYINTAYAVMNDMSDFIIKSCEDSCQRLAEAVEDAKYQIGYTYYKKRDFTNSINELNTFLSSYPNSDRASKAQYYKAYSYYSDENSKCLFKRIVLCIISDHSARSNRKSR